MEMIARVLAAVLGIAACWVAPLAAQGYPTKPVRVIVTSLPGGVLDVSTRIVTPKLTEALGQPVIVENRAGADGMIGTEFVARAAPDGYTLLAVFDNFPLTQYLVKKVPYDAIRDFTPISLIIRGPMIAAVPAQLGVKDLNGFVQLAKSKGNLSYGSAGIGSSSHLVGELFKSAAGIDIQFVHYKGGAPAMNDLVGGHVQLMIAAFGTILPQVKSGKLTPLAVSAPKRVPLLPNVPTIGEFYPGFEAQTWVGLAAPAGTPNEIIRRLNAETVKALADREVRQRFEAQGYEVVGSTPEVFVKWIAEQDNKWGRLIRERGITQN